jgi:four helix bundle protein
MRNEEIRMTNEGERVFDLEERTARFGERVIGFCKRLPRDEISRPLLSQLVRAATSVGANYCEADDADSKKDFHFKIGLCRREARRPPIGSA